MDSSSRFGPLSKQLFDSEDARRIARRKLPKLIFDFVEGAAGREMAAKRNEQAFDQLLLQPRVMADVTNRSLKTAFLGQEFDLPFGFAPMGMCNLVCPNADRIMAQVARERNIPICLSTAASSSIEEMANWASDLAWFQLYVGGPVDQALELVARAKAAGYQNLILTVDVPQISRRVRDLRNGFTMPFRIGPRQFLDFALHPVWSLRMLRFGAPEPRNFLQGNGKSKFERGASRTGANWEFLDRLRDVWPGNLIVKGVLSKEDAARIKAAGVDAIYVSSHGGRQLDGAPPALDILPDIRAEVGADYPLILDSGVRSGEDVIKARAAGADFVMLGRPVLYALGAQSHIGLRSLVQIFEEEASVAMAQIGMSEVEDISENNIHGRV